MHVTPLEIVLALVLGGAASAAGGYISGRTLNGEAIGTEMAGYLGLLYGPTAGVGGVVIGLIVVGIIAARA
jgi:hypothetical protein